jgi:hypothetical protein
VKDGFVVGFFSAEQVIHDAREFMSCGGREVISKKSK